MAAEALREGYVEACEGGERRPLSALLSFLDDVIGSQTQLSSLILKGNSKNAYPTRLDDGDLEALLKGMRKAGDVALREFDLSWNVISDHGIGILMDYLREFDNVIALRLSHNNFGIEGAKRIAEAINDCQSLSHLFLDGNKIEDRGGLILVEKLARNTSLRTISLGCMDLGHQTFTMLGKVLTQNNSITTLNIDRPILFSCQEESIYHLASGLKLNKTLRSLSIKNAGLRDHGCFLLCDNLMLNETLTELDLSSNRLSEISGQYIHNLLKKDLNLMRLKLSCNKLCDRGCEVLAQALPASSIVELDISYNEIGSQGIEALSVAIAHSTRLKMLCIWGNHLDSSSLQSYIAACNNCRSLSYTDVLMQIVDGEANAVRRIEPEDYYFPGLV
eukprot:756872-Hanusia_phi.AAC.10